MFEKSLIHPLDNKKNVGSEKMLLIVKDEFFAVFLHENSSTDGFSEVT